MTPSKPPLYLAFLWHMHQPYYWDPVDQTYALPWVRLHGLKDYYDMPALLAPFPNLRQTFNLVPSLLSQLRSYTEENRSDTALEISRKPAASLTPSEREFLLQNFFMANREQMIKPYPRYWSLLERRGRYFDRADFARVDQRFTGQDYRDLQVWFNLIWSGETLRQRPLVGHLLEKQGGFSEAEKTALLDTQQAFLKEILPYYSTLQQEGRIELTTTPFYHPILPLLYDTQIARMALPEIVLPQRPLAEPEDAQAQLKRGLNYFADTFGFLPRGIWPAEGAVSEDLIPLLADNGIQWLATDEEILDRSLRLEQAPDLTQMLPSAHSYLPYRLTCHNGSIILFFRDHELSDRIGFVYSTWDPEQAAADFMQQLRTIHRTCPEQVPCLVSVILDGENAWEYFPNYGVDFFKALYTALAKAPDIETTTFSAFLDRHGPTPRLTRLFAGSWINHNFAIWVGHPEKNRAWDLLAQTRQMLLDYAGSHPPQAPSSRDLVAQAWEHIYIAEGSDWFWWYGDDHFSAQDETFDLLFRRHLQQVYQLLGQPVPSALLQPIIQKIAALVPTRLPVQFISPQMDGRISHYYEWTGAGYYEISGGRGAMHQVQTLFHRFYYGFDPAHLFFRIDTTVPFSATVWHENRLVFAVLSPLPHRWELHYDAGQAAYQWRLVDAVEGTETPFGADQIFETALPLLALGVKPGDQMLCYLALVRVQEDQEPPRELERWPRNRLLSLTIPDADYEAQMWFV